MPIDQWCVRRKVEFAGSVVLFKFLIFDSMVVISVMKDPLHATGGDCFGGIFGGSGDVVYVAQRHFKMSITKKDAIA